MIELPPSATDDPAARALAAGVSRHSIESGDVVLCNLPPYGTLPWLSTGLVAARSVLAAAGIRARVVRPFDRVDDVPEAALHASLVTFARDPAMPDRLAAMEAARAEAPSFFDRIVDALLHGPERVVGLSVFRNNVDVSLVVARLLKARRPAAMVVLGGPEAIEDPASLLLPWVDVVVGSGGDAALVPLVEALLAGRPERAAALRGVWLNPSLGVQQPDAALRPDLPTPPRPRFDHAELVKLLVADPTPTMPLLLNHACPYRCAFCSNAVTYGRFREGDVAALVDEMEGVVAAWHALGVRRATNLDLQLSDATTNAIPAQFDALLRAVAERARGWPLQPTLRGQLLLDARVTDATLRLMREARFEGAFFGLETASDRLRRALHKPGSAASVAAAMTAWHRGGAGGLHFGVPVGIPGETDDDFAETERFVDWALGLRGTVASVTVLPYTFFLSAQDPSLLRDNTGERRGVAWRTGGPAGDPRVRARRFMRLFEAVAGRTAAVSPIPPYLALPAMLPDPADAPARDAWMARFGRSFEQLRSRGAPPPADDHDPAFTADLARALARLEAAALPEGWALEGARWGGADARSRFRVVVFRRADGARFALQLARRDDARPAFARAAGLNVSYLRDFGEGACVYDEPLLRRCVGALSQG